MGIDPRLKDLLAVAEAAETREMARLADIAQKIRSIESDILRLRAPHNAPADSAFACSGMDSRWSQWRMNQIARMNSGLATLYAERDQQKQKTSRALGRRLVVEKLLSQS